MHYQRLRSVLCRLLLLLLCLDSAASAASSEEAAKPNILVLYADDWRNDTLGAAGNPVVKTPELDRLASEGIRFTNNYVTTSICGVSRASLFTGQWMSRHGCRGFSMFETPWEETFPALLRESGYYTGHVGKWHNGRFPKGKFDFGRAYAGQHWYERKRQSHIHVTERNENDAMEFLRTRPEGQPFYLTVAFFATHAEDGHPLQFLPQVESLQLYSDVEIPVPPNASSQSWERLPDFFTDANEGRNRWRWRFDTPEKYQYMMKNYYRLASEVDTTCGRIIRELEAQGALENTLVIFTTDNGYYHGEHGLADKWYPHEPSIRVPLIIKDPRMPAERKNTASEAMTLNVDLASTILGAAGIEPPEGMQGHDLSRLYLAEAPAPDWRTEFFYEHPTLFRADFIPASEALVRTDWKYFYWPEADLEQLFYLKTDPHEEFDLVDSPAHQDKLKEMRQRFAELKEAAK